MKCTFQIVVFDVVPSILHFQKKTRSAAKILVHTLIQTKYKVFCLSKSLLLEKKKMSTYIIYTWTKDNVYLHQYRVSQCTDNLKGMKQYHKDCKSLHLPWTIEILSNSKSKIANLWIDHLETLVLNPSRGGGKHLIH